MPHLLEHRGVGGPGPAAGGSVEGRGVEDAQVAVEGADDGVGAEVGEAAAGRVTPQGAGDGGGVTGLLRGVLLV